MTRKCNLRCLHCGSDCTTEQPAGQLTPNQWTALVDYCAQHFSRELTFVITGGEPLLFPDLQSLGRHIAGHGMRWSIVTNGMLLDRQTMDGLVNAGIYGLTISLDGLETTHNRLRQHRASFARALSAIETAASHNLRGTDVVTCVFPENLGQLDAVAELLIERGITAWRLFRIFPSGRARHNDDLLLSFAKTRELLGWISDARPRLKARGLSLNLSCEGFLPFSDDRHVRDEPFFCRAGINIASVLVDGTITGCPNNDPLFNQGNILQDDLVTVWEDRFRRFRDREWSKQGVCAECEHFRNCLGSSIHLWHGGAVNPAFCYARDIAPSSSPL